MPAFPDGPLTRAFRALVRRLQDDPTLRRGVKTWSVWEGKPTDPSPPTAAMCPYVQLTPMSGPSERAAIRGMGMHVTHRVIRVKVQTVVTGYDSDDSMNLYDAIAAVMWPTDPTRRAAFDSAMAAAGVQDVEESQPAFAASVGEGGDALTAAVGFVDLHCYVDT